MGNHRKTIGKWWFNGIFWDLPSGNDCSIAIGTIEIVDFPMNNGDFPRLCLITRGYDHSMYLPVMRCFCVMKTKPNMSKIKKYDISKQIMVDEGFL